MLEKLFNFCQDRGGVLEKITSNNFCYCLSNRGHKLYYIELENNIIFITTKVRKYIKVFYYNENVLGSGELDTDQDITDFINSCIKEKNQIIF